MEGPSEDDLVVVFATITALQTFHILAVNLLR